MEIERAKELWGEFCFHLCENINIQIQEAKHEHNVLLVLEKLNWYQSKMEIKVKPPIQVGTSNKYPDLVLQDNINKRTIIVEIKRPILSLINHVAQLRSYMNLHKSILGLLIGNEIQVYYDSKLYPEHDPIKLATIPFDRKSENGHILMNILDKHNFVELKGDSFLKPWIERYKNEIKIVELIKYLRSDATKHKVLEFLKNIFESYGTDVLNEVLQKTEIRIIPLEVHKSIEMYNKPEHVPAIQQVQQSFKPVKPGRNEFDHGLAKQGGQIDQLLIQGQHSIKEIADKLNLRVSRVNEHIRHLRTDKKHENLNVVIDGNGIVKIERME